MSNQDLEIQEFWEKMSNEKVPGSKYYKVLKGQYELKSTVYYREGGNVEEWKKRFCKSPKFKGEIKPNVFKMDLGSSYGIHSYQIISFK